MADADHAPAEPPPERGAPAPAPWPEDAPSMRRALLAGTWSPDPEAGFEHDWIGERVLREAFTGNRAGRRIWKGIQSGTEALALDALTRQREDPSIAYVYAVSSRLHAGDDPLAPEAFPDDEAVLHVRHRNRLRAWWDGELVLDEPAPADGEWRHVRAVVPLTETFDVLLLKLARGADYGPSMDVEVRLSDRAGAPLPGHLFVPRRRTEYPSEVR